jgi:hypothetical protein
MKARGITLVSVVLLVIACSPAGATRTSLPSPTAGPVPQEVADRAPLPSCGIENATTQWGPWDTPARECFWNAYQQGQPAEFISTRLTTEGDPITTIYRVLSAGQIEVFMDTTRDRFGDQGWLRFDCKTLASAATLANGPDFGVDDSCTQTTLH